MPKLLRLSMAIGGAQQRAAGRRRGQTDALYQINFATLDLPSGDTVRTKDEARIWFATSLKDITGTLQVWVAEEAALALSADSISSAEEFEQAWKQQDLRFLLANVKLCRSEVDGQMQLTIGKAVAHDFGLDFGYFLPPIYGCIVNTIWGN